MTNKISLEKKIEILHLNDNVAHHAEQFGESYVRYFRAGNDPDYVIVQALDNSHGWPDLCADNQCFWEDRINKVLIKEGTTNRRFKGLRTCNSDIFEIEGEDISRNDYGDILPSNWLNRRLAGALYKIIKGEAK